jgi:peptide/nickel transport system ATP-binding protein
MLPDGGKICEEEDPPWRETGDGHRIYCHIPLETLNEFDPVISAHKDEDPVAPPAATVAAD